MVAGKVALRRLKLLRNGESRNATVKGHASVYDDENKKQLRCTITKTYSRAVGLKQPVVAVKVATQRLKRR